MHQPQLNVCSLSLFIKFECIFLCQAYQLKPLTHTQTLPNDESVPATASNKNKIKNRFANIFPCELFSLIITCVCVHYIVKARSTYRWLLTSEAYRNWRNKGLRLHQRILYWCMISAWSHDLHVMNCPSLCYFLCRVMVGAMHTLLLRDPCLILSVIFGGWFGNSDSQLLSC